MVSYGRAMTLPIPRYRRRALLRGSAHLGAWLATHGLSRRAKAGVDTPKNTQIDLPQLAYDGTWNPRAGALEELGREVRLRSRVEPVQTPTVVRPGDAALFHTPFLWVAGGDALPPFDPSALRRLRRFIDLGGLMVFDDASGGSAPDFRRSVLELSEQLAPSTPMREVTPEHVVYRSFYLVDRAYGRTDFGTPLLGVHDAGRLKMLFVPGDLGGAFSRDLRGSYRYPCNPGGPSQREEAIRLGVNIVLYATCTDYKSDRAHVETLERSRRKR